MAPRNAPPPAARPVLTGARGVATVTATAPVSAPARAVYDFLERLPNHALITGSGLRLEGVTADGRGARIALRGPLGIRRTARTCVTRLHRPRHFGGTAQVGRRTVAYVHWTIDHAETGSRVTLTATILRAGPLDRLLLTLGGIRWLTRSFRRAIALLGTAVESATDAGGTYVRMAG
jgi:hypothetical protein